VAVNEATEASEDASFVSAIEWEEGEDGEPQMPQFRPGWWRVESAESKEEITDGVLDEKGIRRKLFPLLSDKSVPKADMSTLFPLTREECRDAEEWNGVHAIIEVVPETRGKARYVRRFLRARGGNVKKAVAMLQNTLRWRTEFQPVPMDEILDRYFITPAISMNYAPFGIHGQDREGRPILWAGVIDMNGLLRIMTKQEAIQNEMFVQEYAELACKAASVKAGRPIEQVCLVLNLQLLTWSNFNREIIGWGNAINGLKEAHFPEFLGKAILLNAPSIFPMVTPALSPAWAALSPAWAAQSSELCLGAAQSSPGHRQQIIITGGTMNRSHTSSH